MTPLNKQAKKKTTKKTPITNLPQNSSKTNQPTKENIVQRLHLFHDLKKPQKNPKQKTNHKNLHQA